MTTETKFTRGQIIEFEGEMWTVVGVGWTNEDGQTFVHLVHTTEGWTQKNGWAPRQINVWI